jgi:ubiquinone/menaquinone biosynthesis C-methylase UbiE
MNRKAIKKAAYKKPILMTTPESNFENSWGNLTRAESYAKLEFPNTYYLAYRDLPKIITNHVSGHKAVDFGCGTGRSTRFLKQLGFNVIGIDISIDMLRIAKNIDKTGDYQLVSNAQYSHLGKSKYDLVQSIFTFDNVPGWENRTKILTGLRYLLKETGKIICLDSTPELYTNEWASFSTKEFPENWNAKTGDLVRDIMLDVDDRRPVDDIFWTLPDYYKLFEQSELYVEAFYKPLGFAEEPYNWISETSIAPWMIFVLSKDLYQKKAAPDT